MSGVTPELMSFIMLWRTDTDGDSIKIPTKSGLTYDYTIDWGDGSTPETGVTGDGTHTYATAGDYTVTISGTFPAFTTVKSNNVKAGGMTAEEKTNAKKLIKVTQWGDIAWQTFDNAFANAINLDIIATDTPVSKNVTDMDSMFIGTSSLTGNKYFNDWDTSSLTRMQTTFSGTTFNAPIGNWNVSNVTYMEGLFWGASKFNQDLAKWDVSKVANMSGMFNGTTDYKHHDLSGWRPLLAAHQSVSKSFYLGSGGNNSLTKANGINKWPFRDRELTW
jgi:surface protein